MPIRYCHLKMNKRDEPLFKVDKAPVTSEQGSPSGRQPCQLVNLSTRNLKTQELKLNMQALRNIKYTLRKYFVPMLMSLIGLILAFSAFMLISVQLDFEKGFDRFHPEDSTDSILMPETSTGWISRTTIPFSARYFLRGFRTR